MSIDRARGGEEGRERQRGGRGDGRRWTWTSCVLSQWGRKTWYMLHIFLRYVFMVMVAEGVRGTVHLAWWRPGHQYQCLGEMNNHAEAEMQLPRPPSDHRACLLDALIGMRLKKVKKTCALMIILGKMNCRCDNFCVITAFFCVFFCTYNSFFRKSLVTPELTKRKPNNSMNILGWVNS